jgi:hypothetical protein
MPEIEETAFNEEGYEVPDWLAGIGTYSVLTVSNKLVEWLTSFLDIPPWAIFGRSVALAISNVVLSETIGRKLIQGSDTAIRVGYIAASAQAIGTGMIQAFLKKNHVEKIPKALPEAKDQADAKKIYEAVLLEKKKIEEKLLKAQKQLESHTGDISDKTRAQQQDQEETPDAGNSNSAGAGGVPPFTNRFSGQSKRYIKKSAIGLMG